MLEVTGNDSRQRSLEGDVAELKQAVSVLQQQTVALDGRFVGFRDETVARLEASEERVKGEIAAFRHEVQGEFASFRSDVQNEFAAVRSEAQQEFAAVRSEARTESAAFRAEFARIDRNFARIDGKFARIDGKFARIDGKFEAIDGRFEGVLSAIEGLRGEMQAGTKSLEARFRLVVWLMGAGLTLYTGTTVSLMVLFFRSFVA